MAHWSSPQTARDHEGTWLHEPRIPGLIPPCSTPHAPHGQQQTWYKKTCQSLPSRGDSVRTRSTHMGRNRLNPCPAILVPARRGSLREQSSDKRHRISLAWRGTSRHALPKAEGEDHLRVPSRVGIGAAEQSERFTEMWPKVIANKKKGPLVVLTHVLFSTLIN